MARLDEALEVDESQGHGPQGEPSHGPGKVSEFFLHFGRPVRIKEKWKRNCDQRVVPTSNHSKTPNTSTMHEKSKLCAYARRPLCMRAVRARTSTGSHQ
jgi:hypothetical protein